jgi:hypothetical protein
MNLIIAKVAELKENGLAQSFFVLLDHGEHLNVEGANKSWISGEMLGVKDDQIIIAAAFSHGFNVTEGGIFANGVVTTITRLPGRADYVIGMTYGAPHLTEWLEEHKANGLTPLDLRPKPLAEN